MQSTYLEKRCTTKNQCTGSSPLESDNSRLQQPEPAFCLKPLAGVLFSSDSIPLYEWSFVARGVRLHDVSYNYIFQGKQVLGCTVLI